MSLCTIPFFHCGVFEWCSTPGSLCIHPATQQTDGPRLHKNLEDYASSRMSYIEEFWDESYLNASDSVVLNLNPFFILE